MWSKAWWYMLLKYHPGFRLSIFLEFYRPYLKGGVKGNKVRLCDSGPSLLRTDKLGPGRGMVKDLSWALFTSV